jgi:hypothetical protein
MPKPVKKQKKTRSKAKNVTQTVIVNVGKRGGSKAPPIRSTPTPLQQALQLLQTQRQPAQGESLIQSTQVLQRMLEPINRQLEVLMKQPVPAISITQPPISITQPAINFPPINFPPISISQTMPQAMLKPQVSMASQTEVVAPPARPAPPVEAPLPMVEGIKPFPPYQLPQTPLSYRDYVLDLPDAPLVQPAKPLVPGGSLRLDPEHEAPLGSDTAKGRLEDVPIEDEKYESQIRLSFDYDRLLEDIKESEGAEGNKKRLPGQYTKKELIDMVANTTGRTFAPSMNWSYDRIKQAAISFVKDIIGSK